MDCTMRLISSFICSISFSNSVKNPFSVFLQSLSIFFLLLLIYCIFMFFTLLYIYSHPFSGFPFVPFLQYILRLHIPEFQDSWTARAGPSGLLSVHRVSLPRFYLPQQSLWHPYNVPLPRLYFPVSAGIHTLLSASYLQAPVSG